MTSKTRSRSTLLLLAVLFATPVVAAIVLHAIGWEPTKTRNHGTLLQPPPDLTTLVPKRADGSDYAWTPHDRRWRVAVVPPPGCAQACVDLIAGLDKVWQLQGRRADRLDVLWFGDVPAGATPFRRFVPMQRDDDFIAHLPDRAADALGNPPLYLIDPTGFLAMRYEPGADISGVREDVARLLK